jgi:hypothetical protein
MAVTPGMIAVALGQTAPEAGSVQEQQWQLWIDDAVMLIEARRDTFDPQPVIDEARLDYVVRQSVVAHIKKPDDATQVTVSVDDASTSRTYQSGKGRITIADEWWDLLGLVAKQEGAFSIDMTPTGATVHLPWCTAHFGALYCSCGADIAGRPIYEDGDLL